MKGNSYPLFSLFLFLFCFLNFKASAIPLLEDLNYSFHPVTTQNEQAQRFFDQGLTFLYAFNLKAAYSSFEQAAKLDPQMAMAYWGMALVTGPVFNTEMSMDNEKKAYDLIQQALQLKDHANKCEKSYIDALSKKYSNSPQPNFKQLASNYKDAMRQVMQDYPDDLDAAVLFVESALDLNSDDLWKSNGEPKDGTLEIVAALESVLKRNPQHIGANHLYIHTMEASKYPQRAVTSANELRNINPILTHLVHAPSHIYLPVGDYEASIQVNEKARQAILDYMQKFDEKKSLGKLGHILLYLTRSYAMAGRFQDSKKSAQELSQIYKNPQDQKIDSDGEFNYSTFLFVLIRFHAWQEILAVPAPPAKMKLANQVWHLARALAYASLGQDSLAKKEQALAQQDEKQSNQAIAILELFLEAKLNEQKNPSLTAQFFQQAVSLQDSAGELPLDWMLFIKENLGEWLLRNQNFKEAESVFRQDLSDHPRNGFSLFGLFKSLKAQSKETDAFWIKQAFDQSWQGSSYPF